jgi:hypothetical protein
LRRNVPQENDILCELYADTLSEVSDNSDNESLDSDSDVPTTSLCKQLRSSAVVVTREIETSTNSKKIVNWKALMIKQVTCGVN